jgi:hypothetical protein
MKLFIICGFIRNIRAVNASLLFMTILVVYKRLVGLEWARSAGLLRACVKVGDCLIRFL